MTAELAAVAFERMEWADVVELLEAVGDDGLTAVDLERLATARYLTGHDDGSVAAWDRAHHAHLADGSPDDAVRCAVWLGLTLVLRGDMAQAGGWLGRAGSLVQDGVATGTGVGYALFPAAFQAFVGGDLRAAVERATEAETIGRSTGQPDVVAMAQTVRGRARLAAGDQAGGVSDFDQAMVAVTAGEISPVPAGIIYCAVIAHCVARSDVRRAAEWTNALTRWCDRQQELVPYRGQCLVHRSQVLQTRGSWSEAVAEAEAAAERLADPPHPALGLAHYQRAELHRLRGQLADAEEAYRDASRHGHDPMPGLAQLRLAQGQVEAAVASMRRAVAEPPEPDRSRERLLAAAVDVFLAVGELGSARDCLDEIDRRRGRDPVPVIAGLADHARAAVLLASDDPMGAIPATRAAIRVWRELEMPYERARSRMLLGRALAAAGDRDAAELELDAAAEELRQLGAEPDLRAAGSARGQTAREPSAGGLTEREIEVLCLVAAGDTNRRIGEALFISEHTVARHLQNIFAKTGVSSRAAATAWAYDHGLV